MPTRQCAGCGRRAPQRELLRFAARDGELVHGREAPGRGAYTCRRLACFERAGTQRGFARVLVGLGGASEVTGVRVVWPDGLVETFPPPPLRTYTTLTRGTGKAEGPK